MSASGGERDGDRKVKEDLVKDLRNAGVDSRTAEERAVKALREADRRARELGRR